MFAIVWLQDPTNGSWLEHTSKGVKNGARRNGEDIVLSIDRATVAEHLKGEFETKDVEATLATMVDDAEIKRYRLGDGERWERRERLPLKVASQSGQDTVSRVDVPQKRVEMK